MDVANGAARVEVQMPRAVFVTAVLVGVLGASARPCFADTIRSFVDSERFSTTVGRVAVETFGPDSCLGQRMTVLNAATGIPCFPDYRVQPGVTFEAEFHESVLLPGLQVDGAGGFEGGFIDAFRPASVAESPLTVTFDSPVAAFGFDTNRFMGSAFTLTITDVAFTRTIAVAPTGTPQFFGFQSASANIRRLSIVGSGPRLGRDVFFAFVVDNFRFGGRGFETAATPEPATFLLVAAGACGAIRQRTRRHRAVASNQ